jgi:hypothetical protein
MRTTLDIDDSVLQAAKQIAQATRSTAGEVISQLAKKGLAATTSRGVKNGAGFPVFSVPSDAAPLTTTAVKSLLSNERLPT